MWIERTIFKELEKQILRGKSILLLGARQTGKASLLKRLAFDLEINFLLARERTRYEKKPDLLVDDVAAMEKKNPLIFIDEVQKVPPILDAVQYLTDRKQAQFILTGSSARKFQQEKTLNMLPGRVVKLRLDPLTQLEWTGTPIEDLLVDGGLPGVITEQKTENREVDLESYVSIFVDEEIRKEALVRNVPAFSRFLEFAALDSGRISNFAEISRQTGVAHTTIASHYQVLTDCLVAERFDPITTSKSRKRLTKSSKYLIFDMGVRRLIAAEGRKLLPDRMGELFEQWVGLELRRMARALGERQTEVHFWRDPSGPEVDWVLKTDTEWIPIEVKWTDKPAKSHATHLETFIDEYPTHSQRGVVICRSMRRSKLSDRVEAWPYQELHRLLQRG